MLHSQNIGCFCPEGLVDVAGECVEPSVCHSLRLATSRNLTMQVSVYKLIRKILLLIYVGLRRYFYNATSAACEQFIMEVVKEMITILKL